MNWEQFILPRLFGDELTEKLTCLPPYSESDKLLPASERLEKINDISGIYIPSQMTVEIYHQLYTALMRSLKNKTGIDTVRQYYENRNRMTGKSYKGVLGGADSFTIIGTSGIGKSTAVMRSIELITKDEYFEVDNPHMIIIPFMIVQCPFDCSIKGLALEIIRKIDSLLETDYYREAIKRRYNTDVIIGTICQVCLNHVGVLIIDEIQNCATSRNGTSLIKSLTQLINASGISICLVGTPDCRQILSSTMQLTRRTMGLSYAPLSYDVFANTCRQVLRYYYLNSEFEITPDIISTLFEYTGGIVSLLIYLFQSAQEVAITNGIEHIDAKLLEHVYRTRTGDMSDYTRIQKPKRSPVRAKKPAFNRNHVDDDRPLYSEIVKAAKAMGKDVIEAIAEYYSVEKVYIQSGGFR